MNRDEIIASNDLAEVMVDYGVVLAKKTPTGFMAKCPFHEDNNPSMSVDTQKGLFKCFGCGAAGSVIDFVKLKEGGSVADAMRRLSPNQESRPVPAQRTNRSNPEPVKASPPQGRIVAEYSYTDELGGEAYQVVRMEPKDFRQRHRDASGNWVWNMQGVNRVLYNLPAILKTKSPYVWIVEGEKDADNLKKCGFVATTNVGGAGKWMDGYTEYLKGKEVVICGDNDDAGRKHVQVVVESICKAVKCIHIVRIPDPHKDASDFIAAQPDIETAARELFALFENATVLNQGVEVPVLTMSELEREYEQSLLLSKLHSFSFSSWLPELGSNIRNLVPGELVTILAGTSVGKTACLQNIALSAAPIPTLLFELELPGSLTFERFAALATRTPANQVESSYNNGKVVSNQWRDAGRLNHIAVCTRPRLTPQDIERIIIQAELKTGQRPRLVLVDYMGLVGGDGRTRYEKTSDNAEQLRIVAKTTKTIIILACQISRKPADAGAEVFLTDAKDSGSIENSSSLLLGAWRDEDDKSILHLKVLKNTKGQTGIQIQCQFNGATMEISPRNRIDAEDVPQPHND